MEASSRTDFIPTTEHGLPINPEEAITQVNFSSFDQPVYRSICVEPVVEIPDPMQRVLFEPTTLVRDDLALEKTRYSKSRSNSIDIVVTAANPLKLEDTLVLQRTKFTTNGDYAAVRANIVEFLHQQNVMFQDSNDSPTLHCSFYQDAKHIIFDVNIYRSDSSLVIEFQRLSGCSMVFCKLFRKAVEWIDKGKCTSALDTITPQQLAAMLQSSQLTAASRVLGLQILRRWLREDPEEAAAAFASLVSSGFLAGPDVVELALEITEISLVHALISLSKLACTDTTELAQRWNTIKRKVIAAFGSGDAHLVSEACQLCCHMQSHARTYAEISSRRFVDNDVISAARSRLDRDSQTAPFCLAVAVRTMTQAIDHET